MAHAGVRIMEGLLPTGIVKDNGRLLVTFSNGEQEIFDTVVAAVGEGVGQGLWQAVRRWTNTSMLMCILI
jgi:hypothetical protein